MIEAVTEEDGNHAMNDLSYLTITRRTLFGIAAGVFVIFVLSIILAGEIDPGSLFFVGPIVIIPLLAGFALRRWTGKTNLIAVVIGLLLIVFNSELKGVSNPTSTIEFVFESIGLFGGVIVIVAASLAFKNRNSEELQKPPAGMIYGFGALIVLPSIVAVIGAIGWIAGSSEISDTDRTQAAAVAMKGFDFEPKSVTATSASIVVSNNDQFRHNFTVEELGIDVEINPGREALVDISGKAAGTYDITCSIAGHEDMGSKLVLN